MCTADSDDEHLQERRLKTLAANLAVVVTFSKVILIVEQNACAVAPNLQEANLRDWKFRGAC
jgi:hypothetical protein